MPIHFLVFLNLQYSPYLLFFSPPVPLLINSPDEGNKLWFLQDPHAVCTFRARAKPRNRLPSWQSNFMSTNWSFLFQHQVTLHDPRLQDPASRLRDLAAPRRTVTIHTLLHEGTFGRVCRGEYTDEETGTKTDVLIKTVSGERDASYSTYQNLVHTG